MIMHCFSTDQRPSSSTRVGEGGSVGMTVPAGSQISESDMQPPEKKIDGRRSQFFCYACCRLIYGRLSQLHTMSCLKRASASHHRVQLLQHRQGREAESQGDSQKRFLDSNTETPMRAVFVGWRCLPSIPLVRRSGHVLPNWSRMRCCVLATRTPDPAA